MKQNPYVKCKKMIVAREMIKENNSLINAAVPSRLFLHRERLKKFLRKDCRPSIVVRKSEPAHNLQFLAGVLLSMGVIKSVRLLAYCGVKARLS
jgi:hypothetical protein